MMSRRTVCAFLILVFLAAQTGNALSLRDCLDLARQKNPALVSARHQSLQAETLVSQARSGYLPNVEARAGYTVQAEPQAIVVPAGIQKTQDAQYLTASVAVDQVLYDFGRTGERIRSSMAQRSAVDESVRGVEQDVLLLTIQAYYRILEFQHQLETATAEVASVKDHLRVVQAMFGEGMVTRNDLLQAEVRLATSKQQQLDWENRIANAWLQLDYLIGKPSAFRTELSEELPDEHRTGYEGESVLTERPDLKAAQFRVAASTAEAKTARSQFLPQIFARAEANYVENSHVKEQTVYAATLGVRCNLFDGFATTAALRRALEEVALNRDRLLELQQAAETEYRSAVNDLEIASARINVLETAISQAEENLRINRERYREQVGTATEVLDAQSLLTQTRGDYYRAVYDRATAQAQVLKALGKL